MHRSGKTTLEIVCAIIAALAALLGVGFMIYLEFKRPLIADVDGRDWKAPKSVVKDLKAMDVNKIAAMDPNRMTAEDAYNTCSMYVVNIRNRGKHKTQHTTISIPKALHWEVSWKTDHGKKTKKRSNTTLITLPDIDCGRNVDVRVWAACDPTRQHAKEMKITQGSGYSARLDIRTPAWPLALYLSQRTSKVVKICVICAIVLFSVLLVRIKAPIQKKYFPRKLQPQVQQSKENGNK